MTSAAVILASEKLNQSGITRRERLHSFFSPIKSLVKLSCLTINLGNLKERISVRKVTALDLNQRFKLARLLRECLHHAGDAKALGGSLTVSWVKLPNFCPFGFG